MQIYIRKRNNVLSPFVKEKISYAVLQAMMVINEKNESIADKISTNIKKKILDKKIQTEKGLINDILFDDSENICVYIEVIQDEVEKEISANCSFEVLKEYISYRTSKNVERRIKVILDKISNESQNPFYQFVNNNYKKKVPPFTSLGQFVYYRTYSRKDDTFIRKENWYETVLRAVDYNTSIVDTPLEEKMELYDNIFNLRQFLAGRTFWIGNTKSARTHPTSNFNCAGIVVDSIDKIKELFYLLMVGAGVGYRILPEDVSKLPPFRNDLDLTIKDYSPKRREERQDFSSLKIEKRINDGTVATIIVGDSKEGWVQALGYYLELLTDHTYRTIKEVIVDVDKVRPEGEPLKTFGGYASGPKALLNMFIGINKIVKNELDPKLSPIENGKLRPIHVLDINGFIAENVVVGGVRRSAMICLFDDNDDEVRTAKSDFEHINKYKLYQRYRSNNSVYYKEYDNKEELRKVITKNMKELYYSGTGEPGFINSYAAKLRRNDFQIVNP